MEKQVIFVRNFTGFAQLQGEQKYTYSLLWSESGVPYGVEISSEKTGSNVLCQTATHIISKRQQAEEFAKFLYDNSVGPEHLPDIIHDFKVQGLLQ